MISHKFTAHIARVGNVNTRIPVQTTFLYDAGTDPFAVQAVFEVDEEEDRVWYFSRELLEAGSKVFAPTGSGDVRFRYFIAQDIVMLCLRSPEGHADISLPAADVREFLDATSEAARVTDEECDALVDEFLKEVFEA